MTLIPDRLTLSAALDAVARSDDGLYGVLLEHGTLELGYYRPRGTDLQQPHDRDELYIVITGHGVFECDGARRGFEPGEALFVPAGIPHRFLDFSDDFGAWVMFYGPTGGEKTDGRN
ncbi:MAG: cupin domain-containing protein [Pseudomonadota bacterium]